MFGSTVLVNPPTAFPAGQSPEVAEVTAFAWVPVVVPGEQTDGGTV